jgi:uncharacterized protein
MSPRVFVVDTNVVVAGLITGKSDSPASAVLDAMLSGALIYLLSPALLDEYRSVISRPKIAALHGLTEAEVDQVLVELTTNAVWRDPTAAQPAPDRGDDPLGALLSGHAGSIPITGDPLLLDEPPAGSSAISPGNWLESFSTGAG